MSFQVTTFTDTCRACAVLVIAPGDPRVRADLIHRAEALGRGFSMTGFSGGPLPPFASGSAIHVAGVMSLVLGGIHLAAQVGFDPAGPCPDRMIVYLWDGPEYDPSRDPERLPGALVSFRQE